MRDKAVGGLAALLRREAWSQSEGAAQIAQIISDALRDPSPLVRMHAAGAVLALYPDADATHVAEIVGDLLLTEETAAVRQVLLHALRNCAAGAPAVVDGILERLLAMPGDPILGSEGGRREDASLERQIVGLLGYLAMVEQAPFSSETVERWCTNAPRTPLRSPCSPSWRVDSSPLVFAMVRMRRTDFSASLRTRPRSAVTRPRRRVQRCRTPEAQRAELRAAAGVAHEIARQLYFASGAFQERRGAEHADSGDLHASPTEPYRYWPPARRFPRRSACTRP